MPIDGQIKFYTREGRGKLESEPPCDTYKQHKSETKHTRPFKFKRLTKSVANCKKTFQVDQRNFSSDMKVKIFFEKVGKSYKQFNNPKHSQELFYRLCGDSLPTRDTNKGKIKLSSGRTCTTRGKEMPEKGSIREAIHYKDQFIVHLLLASKKDGGQ